MTLYPPVRLQSTLSFAESSCSKWQIIDKAEVGPMPKYKEGEGHVVLLLNQQDALQPHHIKLQRQGNYQSKKLHLSESEMNIYVCGKMNTVFHINEYLHSN